jgi:GNAT superfamily N-acetyltransferase
VQPETWDLGGERVTVRRARRDDVAGLAALVGADPVSAARGDSGEGDLTDYEEAFAAIDADEHQLLVVVVREGSDVPVATLQRTLIPGFARRGGWRAELEAVHVAEELRGRGLGARLVGWAVAEARARGCILVQLTSSTERTHAHRFYERLGFAASHVGFKLALD